VSNAHRVVVHGLALLFYASKIFGNAIAIVRVDDVHPIPELPAEAFLGRVAEQLFVGRVHVDGLTRFVDDLDRVAADLGDDAIALLALAKRLARLLAGRLPDLLAKSV
jgi:hypothetical protein